MDHGYPAVMWKNHPLARKNGALRVHKDIALDFIAKYDPKLHEVHHLDENKEIFSPDNLVAVTPSEHALIHHPRVMVSLVCTCCAKQFESQAGTRQAKRNYGFCSLDCFHTHTEKIVWPDYNVLVNMVAKTNYSAVGRQLGVSDNAVRKRIKSRA